LKYLLRFFSNCLAFFLGLYLIDSLIAPRFWIRSWWVGVILAVLLASLNSPIRPLYRVRSRPGRAITLTVATLAMNILVLQVFIWIRAPLSARSVAWLAVAAAFVSLLGGVINWLVGFNIKEKPGTASFKREQRQKTADPGVSRKAARSTPSSRKSG
jgi:uncharacterized membrane protein YvlD (DUF360 family)